MNLPNMGIDMKVIHETRGYTTWDVFQQFTKVVEVDRFIRKAEKAVGGAWAYHTVFMNCYITRANSPSQIPEHYVGLWSSNNQIFWKGQWQKFSDRVTEHYQTTGLDAQ